MQRWSEKIKHFVRYFIEGFNSNFVQSSGELEWKIIYLLHGFLCIQTSSKLIKRQKS